MDPLVIVASIAFAIIGFALGRASRTSKKAGGDRNLVYGKRGSPILPGPKNAQKE